jgi:hypothetical protein
MEAELKKKIAHLARTVGTSTTNTGNTGNSTTSTPRFGTGLVASLLADSVCLPFVLCHAL